ncbi:hypothetical protein B382_23893 [Stutzerimonas stutzeri B1SMN1]|nr:hypothetical protein B382_23893 [Stutzerimonas stutzeri B1SMN1]
MTPAEKEPPNWDRKEPLPKGAVKAIEADQRQRQAAEPLTKVVVVDFKMSFDSLVVFMIKAALAAIPAAIILAVVFTLATVMLGGFLP